MELIVELTRKDFANFNRYWYFKKKLKQRMIFIIIFALVISVFENGGHRFDFFVYLFTVVSILVLFGVSFFALMWLMLTFSGNLPSENGSVLGKKKFILSEDGFVEESENSKSSQKWKSIKAVEENGNAIFVFVDNIAAYIVPKRFFKDEIEQSEFINYIKNNMESEG
jgi:hypothetical protein